MSLQLIVGNSGAGKSTWLYEQVIAQSLAHPEKNYLFLVPEQFTMQTQKEFVRRHPRSGILNIDVLSFQRLAYRVFDQVGGFHVPVLDDTGKSLVLRKVAENVKKDFTVLRGSIQKPGTIQELKSVLSEFMQYQVTPAQLQNLAGHANNTGLRYKLKDLGILYDGFFQYLEEKFITSEQVLSVLCQVIDRSELVKDSVVVLDGFTGFTPLQNEVLHHLMRLAEKVMAALTMDRESFKRGKLPEHALFALSAKTMDGLYQIAREEKTKIEPAVFLEAGKNSRLSHAPALKHLEQQLFRVKTKPYEGEDASDQIFLSEAKDPAREVAYVASRIRRLVREEGYRYGQIAVVSGAADQYGSYIERIFAQYEIPCFLDNTAPLLMNPMIEMIRALLQMVTERFSYESVFRYFRCGLSKLQTDQVDRLENYVLAQGIRGLSMWRDVWVRKTDGMLPEELAQLNQIRQQFMEEVMPLVKVCTDRDTTVREKTEALYGFLSAKELQQQLEEKKEAFEAEGDLARAKEYGQVYEAIIRLLDQYVDLLGEEPVGIREYAEILDAGLSAQRIGLLPPGTDYVVAGDIERTRLTDIRVLFFVGLNDGIVPKSAGSGGILSELEREDLEKEIQLAPTQRENFFIQKFYLYLLVTKASEKIYLSYSSSSTRGEELHPSYFIQTVRRMFPALLVERIPEFLEAERLETKGEMLAYLREGFWQEAPGPLWSALLKALCRDDSMKADIARLQEANGLRGISEEIGREAAMSLYDGLSHVSVTRLEQFARCPHAHFLQYGLGLKERKIHQFTPVDNGNIFHEALERYANQLSLEGYSMADMPDGYHEQLADRCIEESLAGMGGDRLLTTARGQYHVQRMKRFMRRTVWALGEQLRRGQFHTVNFELDFSKEGSIYPVPLFDGSCIMALGGRIDRMDVLDEGDDRYLRIIDYKTGKKEVNFSLLRFYNGLQMQLVVYLQAASALERKRHPEKKIIPAGIFYYHLEDPFLDGRELEKCPDKQEQLLKKLRLKGYVNGDGNIIKKMDNTQMASSSVIPVTFKKDGSLSGRGTAAVSTEQMDLLMNYSDHLLKKLGEDILSGNTAVSPCREEKELACKYCAYAGACGFDKKLPGCRWRNLPRLETGELWRRMEETVCQENGQTVSGR